MNIILVGAGKTGFTLAQYLARDGHDVTVIDRNPERIALVNTSLDVISICGSVDIELLKLAGAEHADLLIAATNSDETNILCCMVGRKLGAGRTIARVRQRDHYQEVILLQEELGLSMTINPDASAAGEISRVLRFPSATKVEPFAKGQAELVEFALGEKNPLCGTAIRELHGHYGRGVLVCAVRRGEQVHIPGGDFILQPGDALGVVGAPKQIYSFFKSMDIFKRSARYVMIVGGGRVGVYLSRQLLDMGIHVKLVEKDPEKCVQDKDFLPKAEVVCCDGSRPEVLEEEGLQAMDALVLITGSDEVNLILAAYAKNVGVDKVVLKVNEEHFVSLAAFFGLEEPVRPKVITAQSVLQYVRNMENASDASGVEMLRHIMDGKLEVLEFRAGVGSPCVNTPLKKLPIRRDVLLAAIIRDGKCLIPGGEDEIWAGDSVLAVTTKKGLTCLDHILRG
ncbi:MAG: Trk system potassium transporter TrkA [Oscillospiraceae bacterium]|nr:Trk system potassium transporter TrkA [Oscillospiraceae bacterium]